MKNIWLILILAILLRFFLAFSTFHPDIQAFNLAGKIVGEGNILNLYDYLPSLESDNPIKNLAVFNYPPPIYLFSGIFNFVFKTIGLPVNQYLLDSPANYGDILFNIHLLFLKLPYLIFDLLTGFVLYKLFNQKEKSRLAFILWLFNPLNLYSTYLMGQFDVIPTFFTILSIYFIAKNKLNLAAIALGFGIAFKLYPIFLLIPLVILGKNSLDKVKVFLLAVSPYILVTLPYLHSHNFRSIALFASQSSKSLFASIPVSGGESILLFPAFLILFYLMIFYHRNKDNWKNFLIPLLLFFVFTHYHPQWLIWITPFLIMNLVYSNFKNTWTMLLLLISFVGSLLFFDSSLTVNMFAPIIPGLYKLADFWTLLHINIDYNFARSILQTIFVGSALFLIYEYTKETSHS